MLNTVIKYIVTSHINPEAAALLESQPQLIQGVVRKWQALNPMGICFSLAQLRTKVNMEVPAKTNFSRRCT